MVVRKHAAKIFFCAACFLLVLSLAFSAYSYARYVTSVDLGGETANPASIDCEVSVNGGGGSLSFVNAPFLQKINVSARPVRMNDWAESQITVRNKNSSILEYEYGLVFYFPQELAESIMFQILELKNASGRDEPEKLVDAVKASKMYGLFPRAGVAGEYELKEIVHICDATAADGTSCAEYGTPKCSGTAIPDNDYDKTPLLPIDEDAAFAKLEEKTQTESITSTFAASGIDANNIQNFIAPVKQTKNSVVRYCRVIVPFTLAEKSNYKLAVGGQKTFVLRAVLRKAQMFSAEWDPSIYWNKDESGNWVSPNGTMPSVDTQKFQIRWKPDASDPTGYAIEEFERPVRDENGDIVMEDGKPKTEKVKLPVLQIAGADEATPEWISVDMTGCMGITSPVKAAAVFTQAGK